MNELLRLYPTMSQPIRCENGCGAVIELLQAFRSYEKDDKGDPKLICECCAAEIGHADEEEAPDESPVCHRQPKQGA